MVGKWIQDSKKIQEEFNPEFINLLASEGLEQTGSFSFKKVGKTLGLLTSLYHALKSKKWDLAYFALTSSGLAFYRDVVLCEVFRWFRVPVVFHLHNQGFSKAKGLRRTIVKRLFRGRKVLILAPELYEDIEAFVPKSAVRILPNGLPEIQTMPTEQSSRSTEFQFLYLSNLMEAKGLLDLLEAVQILDEKGFSFRLTILGGEADIQRSRLEEELQARGISEKVIYIGKKYGAEKLQWLEQSEALVLPSHNECLPLVIIEAMQHSLPVISTPIGGIPSLISEGENGFLVPPKSPEMLADAMARLIQQPELSEQMGKAGFIKFKQNFTLEQFEGKLVFYLNESIAQATKS